MSKVLIIGAGGVGGVVTQVCPTGGHLPRNYSRQPHRIQMQSHCRAIKTPPIRTAQVDADNVAELTALLEKENPTW